MSNPAIATHALTRHFGPVAAVDGIDLEVPTGAVYGFLGPNGAGKTTTIRMLLGLARPDRGEIRLLGEPLAARRLAVLRRVGALVESPSLYPHLTGRENLRVTTLLLGLGRAAEDRALGIVGLLDDADRRAGQYSLGMRQRLGLALALLAAPDLLILDEPTNGLDPQGIQEMRALLRRLPSEHGVTVFLSSHLLAEVEQVASDVGIVHRGQLVRQGPLAGLHDGEGHLDVGVSRAEDAATLLASHGWRTAIADGGLRVEAVQDAAAAARINALLVGAGHDVWRLAPERPSLETLFLRLTNGQEAS